MNDIVRHLPLIRFRAGATDAQLEAERDRKHAREVAEWLREHNAKDDE